MILRAGLAAGAVRLRRPEHLDRLLVRHPRRPVPRLADRSRSRTPARRIADLVDMAATQLGPLAPLSLVAFVVDRRPPAALGAPERHDARPHLLLQLGLPGRRDRPLLHRPGADRLDLAGDPRAGRSMRPAAGRARGRRSPPRRDRGRRRRADRSRSIGLGRARAACSSVPSLLSFSGRAEPGRPDRRPGRPGLDRRGPRRPSSRTPSSSRGGATRHRSGMPRSSTARRPGRLRSSMIGPVSTASSESSTR